MQQHNNMKRIVSFLFLMVSGLCLVAQTGSIRGFVYDKTTGEPIAYGNVILKGTTTGTTTDINGYFVFSKVKAGTQVIKVSFIGYETAEHTVEVEKGKVASIKVELKPSSTELAIVEVSGKREAVRLESNVSVEKITSKDIQQMPSIGGQADLAQYIQVLPGVVFSGDQGGQCLRKTRFPNDILPGLRLISCTGEDVPYRTHRYTNRTQYHVEE